MKLNKLDGQVTQSLSCRKGVQKSFEKVSKIIRRHQKAVANFKENCDEILFKLHI